MPRPFVTLLLFLFAFASSCTRHTTECDINLNSVNLFFAVADSIAQRQEVAEVTWDSLAHSDGYVMAGWQKRLIYCLEHDGQRTGTDSLPT